MAFEIDLIKANSTRLVKFPDGKPSFYGNAQDPDLQGNDITGNFSIAARNSLNYSGGTFVSAAFDVSLDKTYLGEPDGREYPIVHKLGDKIVFNFQENNSVPSTITFKGQTNADGNGFAAFYGGDVDVSFLADEARCIIFEYQQYGWSGEKAFFMVSNSLIVT